MEAKVGEHLPRVKTKSKIVKMTNETLDALFRDSDSATCNFKSMVAPQSSDKT